VCLNTQVRRRGLVSCGRARRRRRLSTDPWGGGGRDGRKAPGTWPPGGLPRPLRAWTQTDAGRRARRSAARRCTDARASRRSWPRVLVDERARPGPIVLDAGLLGLAAACGCGAGEGGGAGGVWRLRSTGEGRRRRSPVGWNWLREQWALGETWAWFSTGSVGTLILRHLLIDETWAWFSLFFFLRHALIMFLREGWLIEWCWIKCHGRLRFRKQADKAGHPWVHWFYDSIGFGWMDTTLVHPGSFIYFVLKLCIAFTDLLCILGLHNIIFSPPRSNMRSSRTWVFSRLFLHYNRGISSFAWLADNSFHDFFFQSDAGESYTAIEIIYTLNTIVAFIKVIDTNQLHQRLHLENLSQLSV
jgi:hypothetical protein